MARYCLTAVINPEDVKIFNKQKYGPVQESIRHGIAGVVKMSFMPIRTYYLAELRTKLSKYDPALKKYRPIETLKEE